MPEKKKSSLKIYYAEKTSKGFNIFEIEHDNRAKFWTDHPTAKEISQKEYNKFFEAAKEARENPV